MKKVNLLNLLGNVLIPLSVYLLLGLMIFEVISFSKTKQFLICGIMAGIVFVVKDIVQNKIVTLGIGIYCVGVVIWLFMSSEKEELHQAIMMLIGIAALGILRYLKKYAWVYIILGYGIMMAFVVLTLRNYEFSKVVVCLAVFVFLDALSETLAFSEKKTIRSNSLVIIYGIVAILTFAVPVSDEPYDWKFVENIADTIKEAVQKITREIDYHWGTPRSDGIYRVSFTGYSDTSSSLMNSLQDSDIEQLKLEGRKTKGNLYLKGNVTNHFTGDGWTYNLKEGTMDVTSDTLMTMYAIFSNIQDEDTILRFVDDYEYQLTFGDLKTSSLFYPPKTFPSLSEEMNMMGDNLRLTSIEERGYTYRVKFLDLDYASPFLLDIIQNSDKITYSEEQYDSLYENLDTYFDIRINEIPFLQFVQDIEQGKLKIKENYTVVDDAVSEAVRSLANTIVQDCENDYEKCKALESFLSRYNYNKMISIPPEANVLDWFLFDGMEGYCTHFSTALVQMLRSVSVPARMVEGFLVDYTSEERFDSYIITAQNAHAWAEAYIDGFGWIRLDATVPDENENKIWYPHGLDSQPSYGSDIAWNEAFVEKQLEKLQKEQELLKMEEELRQEEKRDWIFSVIFIVGLLAVILLMVCMWLLYQTVIVRRSKNPNVIFTDIMKILAKKYRKKEVNETVREYFGNIKNEYAISEDMSIAFQWLTGVLEEYWYGDITPSNDAIEYMKNIRNKIKNHC